MRCDIAVIVVVVGVVVVVVAIGGVVGFRLK